MITQDHYAVRMIGHGISLQYSLDKIPSERGSEVLILLHSSNELEMKLTWGLKRFTFERLGEMVGDE